MIPVNDIRNNKIGKSKGKKLEVGCFYPKTRGFICLSKAKTRTNQQQVH